MKATVTQDDDFLSTLLTAFVTDVGNQFQMSSRVKNSICSWLLKRLAMEGLAFVTKTLPAVGKHFDAALLRGVYTPCSYLRKQKHGNLPVMFSGLFGAVFNSDGTLLAAPDGDAIRLIRQMCFQFYKLKCTFSDEQMARCYESFKKTEQEAIECVPHEESGALYHAQDLIRGVFGSFAPFDIVPRPGPGATACSTPRWLRYEPRVLFPRANRSFPYSRYFYCGWRHLRDRRDTLYSLPVVVEPTSKLLGVPKDSRGPRLICEEPAEMMWLQQGLGRAMVSHIESHPLTRGHVNFTDQKINGSLALQSSVTGLSSTLDAKEASDRVWRGIVEQLFDDVPAVQEALLALSTRQIAMPDGTVLKTQKYAPMGSALCFPVMSITFYALLYGILQSEYPKRPRKEILQSIYVYGDDLIVKTKDVPVILERLPKFGLLLNENKCCYTGRFRESCGVDAHAGVNVTPVKIKSLIVSTSGPVLKKWTDIHALLWDRGLWRMANAVRTRIEALGVYLPVVKPGSPCIGYKLWPNQTRPVPSLRRKWRADYQEFWYKARVVVTDQLCSMNGGWEQLVRNQNHVLEASDVVYDRDQAHVAWKWVPDFAF